MPDHVMFAQETRFGAWATPDRLLPVTRSAIGTGVTRPLVQSDSIGLGGRSRAAHTQGPFGVGGPVEFLFYPVRTGYLLRSMFPDRTSIAVGSGFKTKMLPNDDRTNDSFSFQERRSATLALSATGLKVGQAELTARAREYCRWNLTLVGKDAALSGSTFTDDTPAPAVINPAPMNTALPSAFRFYEAVIRVGGTVVLTDGELVVTGGTARTGADDVGITASFSLRENDYVVGLTAPVRTAIDEGPRDISVRFSPNWNPPSNEFYLPWSQGTPAVVELYFQSSVKFDATNYYEAKLTLPQVRYIGGALPDVSPDYGLRRITMEGVAEIHDTLGYDWGLTMTGTEDLSVG